MLPTNTVTVVNVESELLSVLPIELPEKKMLCPVEAGDALGVSDDTVYRLIQEQSLKGVKVRGQYRIPRLALVQYLLAQMRAAE